MEDLWVIRRKQLLTQFKMNCQLCGQPFADQQGRLPRVLVSCGHTVCENCIELHLDQSQIKCPECTQLSFGSSLTQYPANATLISLLKKEDQAVCKAHKQKLQAYCEKDHELLCLSCLINGQHKNHKIVPIADKVSKDRSILQECAKSIQSSFEEIRGVGMQCEGEIQRLSHEYKDYLFEVGLCFKTLKASLQELEESCLLRGKEEYERNMAKYSQIAEQLEERERFMRELMGIYNEVMGLPNLQYLNEDNKRVFIMENCKWKRPKVESLKVHFNKISAYSETQSAIQELIAFEKKLQGQATPSLKQKKSSRAKQPTILEVNLNDHYKKHYKSICPQEKPKLNKEKSVISIKTPKPLKDKAHSHQQSIMEGADQSHERPDRKSHDNSFQSDACLPVSMIHSFMESSNHSLSIKGSEADFTICSFDTQIYHFGSFSDSSVEYGRMGLSTSVVKSGVNRSKAQCAILPSYSPFVCLIMGGKSNFDEKLDSFIEYDLQFHQCRSSVFRLSEPKSGFGCAVRDSRLYIAGGSNNTKSLRSFQEYRMSGQGLIKSDLPPMNHSRDELGLVMGFDGSIYACGGINESGSVLASCERYNWAKSRWEMLPSMKKPRRCFALVSLPHGIYAIGGYDGSEYLREVELFDFTTGRWVAVSSLRRARFAHTAVASGDMQEITVCGGFNEGPMKSVEKLSVLEDRWSEAEELQVERFLHCSLAVNF